MTQKRIGLVLLSGGLDSTTAAAWAIASGMTVSAISFDYGQTHRCELAAATAAAKRIRLRHNTVDVTFYRDLAAHTALTNPNRTPMPTERDTSEMADDIPSTYVPLRNTFFLTMGVAWLESAALRAIEEDNIDPRKLEATLVIAANAIDYSGYPDCHPEYYETIAERLRLGSKIGKQYNIPFSNAPPP